MVPPPLLQLGIHTRLRATVGSRPGRAWGAHLVAGECTDWLLKLVVYTRKALALAAKRDTTPARKEQERRGKGAVELRRATHTRAMLAILDHGGCLFMCKCESGGGAG